MNHLDAMFEQYSEAFLGTMTGEGDIVHREKIDTAILNYSLESLHEVDRYLKFLYEHPIETSCIEYQNVVVWCGAYIGEVIRKNAAIVYHWVHYEEYMKGQGAKLKNMIPYTLTTHALLVADDSSYVTMPMNKVARWLEEGEANNVHFYAGADISRKKHNDGFDSSLKKSASADGKPWWKLW
ncbi:hypothetical protein Q4E93_18820 [Flavitalea sp. BT771]|uniref:hypothetical protein n=1 Tax=Flavitalea sp. BT771 TaxID=3063329 RepID=UPI0026E26857|nr:hypothetical protein [Flavitalea sp. BT771]MDO6432666.1 hypothetical protein [Flavitalea sp. BT771]MDV6222058.1 hypothetical protein [Flavitalea sp. BT771]